jgi:predicted NUDIX family NTP pyrophosphohydrolase
MISNTFALEWPPGSGKIEEYPEIDRVGWFGLGEARVKISKGQVGFLDRLVEKLKERRGMPGGGADSSETPKR